VSYYVTILTLMLAAVPGVVVAKVKTEAATVRPGLVVGPGPPPSPLLHHVGGGGADQPASVRVWKTTPAMPGALACRRVRQPTLLVPGAPEDDDRADVHGGK
jgi:hypothetical protein